MRGWGSGFHAFACTCSLISPSQDLNQAPEMCSIHGKKDKKRRLIHFAGEKNLSLDNPQLCQAVNRVLVTERVFFQAWITFAGKNEICHISRSQLST